MLFRGRRRACALFLLLAGTALAACPPGGQPVAEERYVRIGGIEQWVTLHGADCRNPVVLFVHGGPGNPLSPFARTIYREWEREFTLVQWDQRGAGQTFARNPPAAGEALDIARMAQDGVELAAHVAQHLGRPKVTLVAGSWGTVLAVHMVKARPDLFAAYVGAGQLVGGANPPASYDRTLALARAAGDEKTVAALQALGAPPWKNPRNLGVLRRATRVYEARSTDPAPRAWWQPAPAYATPAALSAGEAGEEYSYVQFVGMQGDGLLWKLDLSAQVMRLEVPVFLLQGEHDLVTTPDVARRWFDGLEAPGKAFILLPRTGHDPNPAMVEAQYRVLKDRVLAGRR